jgi:prepilin-type N-terminal cleavage/methylation domain-containing protein
MIHSLSQLDRRRNSGTTLIELLVVLAIVTLLLAITIPAVQMARESARNVACKSQLRQLAFAVSAYHDSNRVYPISMGPWTGKDNDITSERQRLDRSDPSA